MDRPEVLRVATANCASGRGADGRPDLPAWARDAAALGVDVLAVQEVDHLLPRSGEVDQAATIAAACAAGRPGGAPWQARLAATVLGTPGPGGPSRPAARTDVDQPSYGVALLSRHPVRAWSELRMPASRAALPVPDPTGGLLWAPDEQRVALAAVVAAPAGDVSVLATHLSFAPHRAAAQLRDVRRWARSLPRPLVLLGDLNLPGPVPSLLTGWTSLVQAPTFPARRPRVQLDHVGLDPGRSGVVGRPDGVHRLGGSDHLAPAAVLTWPS